MAGTPFKMKGSAFKYEREAQMRTSTGWTRLKKGIKQVGKTGKKYIDSNIYGFKNAANKVVDVISGRR